MFLSPILGGLLDVPSGAFTGPGALHRCLRHLPFSRGGHQAASSSPSTDAAITNTLAPPLTDPAKISLGWVPGSITAGESDLTQLSTADDLPHDPPPGHTPRSGAGASSVPTFRWPLASPPCWFFPLREAYRNTRCFNFPLSDYKWFWVPRHMLISFSDFSSLISLITVLACFPIGVVRYSCWLADTASYSLNQYCPIWQPLATCGYRHWKCGRWEWGAEF